MASDASAAAAASAAEDEKCWVYGFKGCPLHDSKCPKSKAWLGGGKQRFYTEIRTRQAIFDHLMNSPFHNGITSVEAQNFAWAADVESWEIEADDSMEKIQEQIQWEGELCFFDNPDLAETVNEATKAGKGGGKDGKGGSKGSSSSSELVAASRKRPAQHPPEPSQPPVGAGQRQIARIAGNLEQNIKQQTQNAYVFVQAMSRAESALRTAARVSESAHRTFMDIPNLRQKI